MNRSFLRETNFHALSVLHGTELSEDLSSISKVVLQEVSITGLVDAKPFIFFYGRGRGAVMVVYKNGANYDVSTFKTNDVIGKYMLTSLMNEGFHEKLAYSALIKFAENHKILKKKYPTSSGKEFKAIMIHKEGVSLGIVDQYFPELSTPESHDSENVEGLEVVGLDSTKNKADVISAIKKSVGLCKRHGFSQLLYGEIYVIGSAMSGKALADYSPTVDKIRLKVSKSNEDFSRTILHELGHRQYYKFKTNKQAVYSKYIETKRDRPVYDAGLVFLSKKYGQVQVTSRTINRKNEIVYKGSPIDDPRVSLVIPADVINSSEIIKGNQQKPGIFHVSNYAMTADTEFFAEVFSFGLMSNNKILMDWIKEVT